jgi:hypothetical protein
LRQEGIALLDDPAVVDSFISRAQKERWTSSRVVASMGPDHVIRVKTLDGQRTELIIVEPNRDLAMKGAADSPYFTLAVTLARPTEMRVGAVVVLAYVAVDTLDFILSEEQDMADYFGKIGPDLAKAVATTWAGHLVFGATVVLLPAGLAVGFGIGAGFVLGLALDAVIGARTEKWLAEHIRAFLKSAEALERLEEMGAYPPGVDRETAP